MTTIGAVVLAGGLGQRMHPLTLDCPKPLLPVGDRTLVEHQVERVVAAGADRVVLSTGYRRQDFAETLARVRGRGVDLVTVEEERPLGTGGGLREALRALPRADVVIVLNGDLITGHDLAAQVSRLADAPAGTLACLHVRDVPDPERYGSVVLDDEGCITDFVEKSPAPPSSTINAGTYVVRRALLEVIPDGVRLSLEREVFPRVAAEMGLVAHLEEAYFLDVGSPAALVAANSDHVLGRSPGGRAVPGGRLVLPGAEVHPSALVDDGSVVHPGAVIGPGAHVSGSVVLAGARVGVGATVRDSVVGRRAELGEGSALSRSAIGSDERVVPGERLEAALRPPREEPDRP